jgi:RimJ/RimL family protein N-acetyltransferase
MNSQLIIRSLESTDACKLSAMLLDQHHAYVHFFRPFDFDEVTVGGILRERRRDVYMGIFWGEDLAGFFMLRGWDDGYEVPTYGVLIDEKYCGIGFAPLSLRMAKIIGKAAGARRIMLKVDPDNACAKAVFERARFVFTEAKDERGRLIYHFDLDDRHAKS